MYFHNIQLNDAFRFARGSVTKIIHAFVFSRAQVVGSISAPVNIKDEMAEF
jgi:hypothetical protein